MRTRLLIGAVGTCLTLLATGFLFSSGSHPHFIVWMLVAFIGFFALSQGAVIWVYIAEVFPTQVRSKGQSLEGALRDLLRQEAMRPKLELANELRQMREELRKKYGTFSDSAALIREDRDSRG